MSHCFSCCILEPTTTKMSARANTETIAKGIAQEVLSELDRVISTLAQDNQVDEGYLRGLIKKGVTANSILNLVGKWRQVLTTFLGSITVKTHEIVFPKTSILGTNLPHGPLSLLPPTIFFVGVLAFFFRDSFPRKKSKTSRKDASRKKPQIIEGPPPYQLEPDEVLLLVSSVSIIASMVGANVAGEKIAQDLTALYKRALLASQGIRESVTSQTGTS